MFRNQAPMQRRMPFQPPMQQRGPGMFGGGGGRGMGGMGTRGGAQSGGGILSRLFQRQSAPQAASMFSRAAGVENTSFLQSLTNPQTVNNFLTQSQQVLNTAQQFGPMIKQYGPIVRNLPAMWKLYQGFKNSPSSDEPSDEVKVEAKKEKKSLDLATLESSENIDIESSSPRHKPGESIPKLYIH